MLAPFKTAAARTLQRKTVHECGIPCTQSKTSPALQSEDVNNPSGSILTRQPCSIQDPAWNQFRGEFLGKLWLTPVVTCRSFPDEETGPTSAMAAGAGAVCSFALRVDADLSIAPVLTLSLAALNFPFPHLLCLHMDLCTLERGGLRENTKPGPLHLLSCCSGEFLSMRAGSKATGPNQKIAQKSQIATRAEEEFHLGGKCRTPPVT